MVPINQAKRHRLPSPTAAAESASTKVVRLSQPLASAGAAPTTRKYLKLS